MHSANKGPQGPALQAALVLGGLALLGSVFLPYWQLKITAPQYPKGLRVQVYLNHVEGDVREIDTLNHYIGMRPLGDAAKLERSVSLAGVIAMMFVLLSVVFYQGRLSVLLLLPVVVFPAVFVGDLTYWMRDFGLNLNPHAALSSSVKPFIPPLFGQGKIAQFNAVAWFGAGFYLSSFTSAVSAAAGIIRLFGSRKSS